METNQDKLREQLNKFFDKPSMSQFALENNLEKSWFSKWLKKKHDAGLKTLTRINEGIEKLGI